MNHLIKAIQAAVEDIYLLIYKHLLETEML